MGDWLDVRTGCEHSGGAFVQGLTLQRRIHFNGTLVPAESALWVCHMWRGLGGALAEPMLESSDLLYRMLSLFTSAKVIWDTVLFQSNIMWTLTVLFKAPIHITLKPIFFSCRCTDSISTIELLCLSNYITHVVLGHAS